MRSQEGISLAKVLRVERGAVVSFVGGGKTTSMFRPAANSEHAEGQSISVRMGIEALPSRTGAVLFLLADQPMLTADMIRTMVQLHRRTFAPACVPEFEGQRGNTVLFSRTLFRELRELRGDKGARALLEKYPWALVDDCEGLLGKNATNPTN
jgi:CTP:molybdopterin cytidylyltransferase MocA